MNKSSLVFLLLIASSQTAFAACTTAACKEAAEVYASDRKLCAEEGTSSARMQCLRDAKAEYNRALADAKAQTAPPAARNESAKRTAPACPDCARVTGVLQMEKKGEGSVLGMIGGGIAGALLGNQVGKGTGRKVATVAGAAGGAYAGKKIEESMRTKHVWVVQARLDGGEERNFEFDQDPGFAVGDLVRLSGDSIVRR